MEYQLQITTNKDQTIWFNDVRFNYLMEKAEQYSDCQTWKITGGGRTIIEHINLSDKDDLA